MVDFETAIQAAVAAQEIPGCAVAATNRDGNRSFVLIVLVHHLLTSNRLIYLL